MKKNIINKLIPVFILMMVASSCNKDYLELTPIGTSLEVNYYQTEGELFEGLVAVYDVMQWGGTSGWTMNLGLLNAASDDCFAGGSDASDQPSWVAYDNFTLNPTLGPQEGLWTKYFAGIYRANLILQKLDEAPEDVSTAFKARVAAEAKIFESVLLF